jgi:hypothetical protein
VKHIFGVFAVIFLAIGIGVIFNPPQIVSKNSVFIACLIGGLASTLVFLFSKWAEKLK